MKKVGKIRKLMLTRERIMLIIEYLLKNEKLADWSAATRKLWLEFLANYEDNVTRIYYLLRYLVWKPGPFHIFSKQEGKKLRKIYESEPEDLIVDTLWFDCLMYVFFNQKQIIPENCYGSIKDKGLHEIRRKIINLVKHRTNLYVYIGDTRLYYPTIDHEVLYNILLNHIKDKWLLWLSKVCIERMPGYMGVALGLPSSNPIGHIYHSVIDWYTTLVLKCKRYYRFCDDKWIFHKDNNYLHTIAREIVTETDKQLKQEIKKTWRVVNCKEERFECLGAMINSHSARLRKFSRRRIEKHIKSCIRSKDPIKTLRTWSGIKGSLKNLDVSNLIDYWRDVYPEFFDLLTYSHKILHLNEKRKKWHKKLSKIIEKAPDCRSEFNKIVYPMDLSSSRLERRLKLNYEGKGMAALNILYIPIKITLFEVVLSWQNPGKECLVFQAIYLDRNTGEIVKNPIWTESYKLIKDIKDTLDSLPHYTKIIKNRDLLLYYTLLNAKEKLPLVNL